MKFIDEYRDGAAARRLAQRIRRATTRPHTIMEVCGGQTHSIVKFGIDQLLPDEIMLIHGPGCPVCVTPVEKIDRAIALTSRSDVILCSFGDMLRVPGSQTSLLEAKALGGDVRIVYAPVDAVRIAQRNPDTEVVFFAVGFETTAPANALAIRYAHEHKVTNFSMLVSHVLVPPALEAILSSPLNRVDGFLAAGHVCSVMGCAEYVPIAKKYQVPIVVTGFEPVDILLGIYKCVWQLEAGRAEVENPYRRAVRTEGNIPAQALIQEVFTVVHREWRGIGDIPHSGLGFRDAYRKFDAELRFDLALPISQESSDCISGLVLQGVKKPVECPEFGKNCTPDHPLGAPMVSAEGACAAYYRYRQGTTIATDPMEVVT